MKRWLNDRGMVTAEAAVIAPFLVGIVFAGVWVVSLGTTQAAAHAAAHEAARLVARGEPIEAAHDAVHAAAPDARVDVAETTDDVTVVVTSQASLPMFSGVGVDVVGRATARLEVDP